MLALREIEQRLANATRLLGCICSARDSTRVVHGPDEISQCVADNRGGLQRQYVVPRPDNQAGDGRLPDVGDLCLQPTFSRLGNLLNARAPLRIGRALVEHYCQSFHQVPRPSCST